MRKAKYSEDVFGPDIDSPADPILIDAWDAETPAKRVKLARKALSVDLDAIDAYNLLGIYAETHAERIALFREATSIGRRLFQPVLDDKDMEWWGFMGTRPWMRAQHNLGLALLQAGDRDEAISVFKSLLALNPNDNQGIRMLLVKLMAEAGLYDDCDTLLSDYPDDASIELAMTRLMIALKRKKPKDLTDIFAEIAESNRHVLGLLENAARSGKWPKRSNAEYIALGSKQEASVYLCEFKDAWQRDPKLLTAFLDARAANQQ